MTLSRRSFLLRTLGTITAALGIGKAAKAEGSTHVPVMIEPGRGACLPDGWGDFADASAGDVYTVGYCSPETFDASDFDPESALGELRAYASPEAREERMREHLMGDGPWRATSTPSKMWTESPNRYQGPSEAVFRQEDLYRLTSAAQTRGTLVEMKMGNREVLRFASADNEPLAPVKTFEGPPLLRDAYPGWLRLQNEREGEGDS